MKQVVGGKASFIADNESRRCSRWTWYCSQSQLGESSSPQCLIADSRPRSTTFLTHVSIDSPFNDRSVFCGTCGMLATCSLLEVYGGVWGGKTIGVQDLLQRGRKR